ncbi:MAG: methenyltetrahydromethanopterin cyclohydrolase [Planctomycetota bacterium]|nr:methenyltetrahydromethanopterin cyclohydrolase [Planctomycetota bacterium]
MAELNLNARAMKVAVELERRAEEVGAAVHRVGGATVIDAGVDQPGSLAAGVLLARACLADLGDVTLVPGQVGSAPLPTVVVHTANPVAACMASQYAGWRISVGDYFAMGSGPMRAARGTEPLFDDIGHRESPGLAVGVLEAGKLPGEAVVAEMAQKLKIPADRITLLVARTASLAGGTQVVARSVETALHKLHELKFDLKRVVGGFGSAPLPPVAKHDMAAIGRTNDAVLYGGQVTLFVTGDDESLAKIVAAMPSSASRDYGQPFYVTFKRYGFDFYKLDPLLFSPAVVSLQNIGTGKVHTAGQVNHEVLALSFLG